MSTMVHDTRAPQAPPLTVWFGSAMYTFSADRDITVGRDPQADLSINGAGRHAVSRTHAVLRHTGAQWQAIDKSRNGIFVDGMQASIVPIDDDTHITLGSPHGPRLSFRTSSGEMCVAGAEEKPRPAPARPAAPRPAPARAVALEEPLVGRMTGAVKKVLASRAPVAPPGSTPIGRAATRGILLDDPLASRIHAYLVPVPGGHQIRDNRSRNGTFVNGERIEYALLKLGDVVTIGNVDLTFAGSTLIPRPTTPQGAGLHAHQLGLAIDGRRLLDDITFAARPGTLTAVIGPSGAGKSTLIKLLGGTSQPTSGWVGFDGHDLHAEYASLRSRIGMVPQDDVVHRQLTVEQALDYAAELRLPPDSSPADREQVVARVLDELELTEHRAKRVDKLSGGQRKRASVAMELLTGPSLLILDEPTSGLDPALDRQVMGMLRRLADAGRVVVVVTHSLTYLRMCDQVLLLAPGGKTAYSGPPAGIRAAMGTTDWADIFAWVSSDPDGAHRAYLNRDRSANRPPQPAGPLGPLGSPARTSMWRQVSTVARRQVRLIVSDRGYFIFLTVLPFILGVLSLVVPGDVGLGIADAKGKSPNEPSQILTVLNIAAVFMGTALSVRDLVGERPIFRREQAVGLAASAYLAAKVLVYSVAASVQVAVLTIIIVLGKGGPTRGAVLLGSPVFELYLTLAATAIVSALLGLAMSSLAKSSEQILPMLVVAIMVSIVFSGGMIPVTGRLGLDQLSWLLPARWGYAASASTVDLRTIAPFAPADESLWSHTAGWWMLDMFMLTVLAIALTALVAYRLRLPGHTQSAAVAPAVAPVVAPVIVPAAGWPTPPPPFTYPAPMGAPQQYIPHSPPQKGLPR
jgi:ABC-type multidrug transport system ATPase subunit/pSer/pThr/pTyr-binding forkhead associated (FHA) protein